MTLVEHEILETEVSNFRALPRKEVIQPQVPLRLPCYDFIPITKFTVGRVIADFGRSRLS